MIYDFRLYTLKPGATPQYRAGVKEVGLPIRQRHGIALSGWYYSEVGALNQVVHIWGYRDLQHLQEAKAAVYADPDWEGKYVPRARPLVESQQTWLMEASDFAPDFPVNGPIPEEGSDDYRRKNQMVYDYRQYTFNPGGIPAYRAGGGGVGRAHPPAARREAGWLVLQRAGGAKPSGPRLGLRKRQAHGRGQGRSGRRPPMVR